MLAVAYTMPECNVSHRKTVSDWKPAKLEKVIIVIMRQLI